MFVSIYFLLVIAVLSLALAIIAFGIFSDHAIGSIIAFIFVTIGVSAFAVCGKGTVQPSVIDRQTLETKNVDTIKYNERKSDYNVTLTNDSIYEVDATVVSTSTKQSKLYIQKVKYGIKLFGVKFVANTGKDYQLKLKNSKGVHFEPAD